MVRLDLAPMKAQTKKALQKGTFILVNPRMLFSIFDELEEVRALLAEMEAHEGAEGFSAALRKRLDAYKASS
jgi:hypothetical protein